MFLTFYFSIVVGVDVYLKRGLVAPSSTTQQVPEISVKGNFHE